MGKFIFGYFVSVFLLFVGILGYAFDIKDGKHIEGASAIVVIVTGALFGIIVTVSLYLSKKSKLDGKHN